MPSPFTLRPHTDTIRSDDWWATLKSDPTKDYWEHVLEMVEDEEPDLYLYMLNDAKTVIGTSVNPVDADIPSISSADGKLTNITSYVRGKATPIGVRTFELTAAVGAYGSHLHFDGDGEWYNHSYECIQYLDLEDDLWDVYMAVTVAGTDMYSYKWIDYIYLVVNYVPAPPTCFQQSITFSDDIKTMIVSETRFRYYTWLLEYGYEIRVKDSEDILFTDVTEGDRDFRAMAWFGGERYPDREIDISAYVRCGVTYEARSFGTTEDGKGVGDWVEFSVECPKDYPVVPVLFPAQLNKNIDGLKQKCRNFEESMSAICLAVNHNTTITRRYLQEIYGDTTYPESSNLRYILPSQQLIKILKKDADYKEIINNFITNISSMFTFINDNNTLVKAWLDDYMPDEIGHEFTDVKMKSVVIGDDLSKAMEDLFNGMEDNVTILNANLGVLIERF